MSDVVDDDVVAVTLAAHRGKFHVMTPLCTCAIGSYAGIGRLAATYHVPTGRLARDDGIELLEKWVCGTCRRSLKAWIRNDRERARFKRWRIETGTLGYIGPQELKRYRQWRREQEAENAS